MFLVEKYRRAFDAYVFAEKKNIIYNIPTPKSAPQDLVPWHKIGTHLVNQFSQKVNLVNPFGHPTISINLVLQFGQWQFGQNGPNWK
jgi:hypothetical protein